MTNHHPAAAELVPLSGPVAALATVASLLVAFVHLRRLHRTSWPDPADAAAHPTATSAGSAGGSGSVGGSGNGGVAGNARSARAVGSRLTSPDHWIEAGHAVVAVGMAIMFVAPAGVVGSWPFFAVYLAVTVALLVALLAHPRCGGPALWSCCALLLVEAAAMACMSGAVGIARWPLRTDGALGVWCVVLFGGAFLTALVGLPARRFATPPLAALLRAFPDPVAPRASRLVMSGGMVLMLLAQTSG